MKKRFLYLIPTIITLILEILPYGAVCNFADSAETKIRKTYSYFSPVPYGYANFAPFLTAIITCLVFLLLIIYCVTEKNKLIKPIKVLLCIATVLSVCPLFYGLNYFSVVGALITVTFIAEFCLIHFTNKAKSKG